MFHCPKGVYGPEELEILSVAYRYALMHTKLDRDLIARRVMVAAAAGIRDVEALKAIAARELRPAFEPACGALEAYQRHA